MIINHTLDGEQIYLRILTEDDCSDKYVSWMNDEEINKHLESKWINHTLASIRSYIRETQVSENKFQFGIFLKETDEHIGNIKLELAAHYNKADIGYLIGEKKYWHRGIATEAIGLCVDFGFAELGLHRIEAGAYETAIGSWKALESNGFAREGCRRQSVMVGDSYINCFMYGRLADS